MIDYEDYREDVRKYAEGLDPVRIQAVFDSIPSQRNLDTWKGGIPSARRRVVFF